MLAMISSEVHSSHSKAALLPCSALDELLSLSLRKEPCQPICCFARRRKEKEEETRESRRRKCFKHPAGRLHWQIPRKFHPSMVLWRSKNRPGDQEHDRGASGIGWAPTQPSDPGSELYHRNSSPRDWNQSAGAGRGDRLEKPRPRRCVSVWALP